MKAKVVSFETLQRRKRKLRAAEARRLAERTTTPVKLQAENSLVPLDAPIRILNLSRSLKKHYAR